MRVQDMQERRAAFVAAGPAVKRLARDAEIPRC
jgi:hypothetical protein